MPTLSTSVDNAVARLRAGELVAVPTETVYGLAANASNGAAVEAVFALKGRPSHNPLIVHVSGPEMAKRYGVWNALADKLAAQHWPGALTLVLPLREGAKVAPQVLAGGDTIALRCPAHPLMREVLTAFGRGLAAPSANRSGRISPTQADHVLAEFPEADLLVLDGGPCEIGLESTVVDCTEEKPVVLRPGSVDIDGHEFANKTGERLKSPGLLASHYAPNCPVRLNATTVEPDEALLAFGPNPPEGGAKTLNLSERGDLAEAAQNLYAMLRKLDEAGAGAIVVMPIPSKGMGHAINDRLARAAHPRD